MPDARILVINNLTQAAKEIAAVGAEDHKVEWLASRTDFFTIKLEKIKTEDAILIKNDMLEIGGNAAYNKKVYTHEVIVTDMILSGTRRAYDRLTKRLRFRTTGAARVADRIDFLIENHDSKRTNFLCRDKRIPVGRKSIIMGVVNITPGSDLVKEITYVENHIEEGADIIDICGSQVINSVDMAREIAPLVKKVHSNYSIPICVDTSDSEAAKIFLDAGAHIVNDPWGAQNDENMAKVVASYKAGIILMHNKKDEAYVDMMGEIVSYLRRSIIICQSAGIGITSIAVDPGIGFGKNLKQNYEIIRKLRELKSLGVPLMVGTSRKEMIGKLLNLPPKERVEGTAATVTAAIMNGADIIRVHDVREMKRVAIISDEIAKK
ncbi:MAG: dihydropteroate synthase [Clostridia bacterium]|nr:dihydropteroate synthase [Clostridia bacterium]